jgi:hypothetical protein
MNTLKHTLVDTAAFRDAVVAYKKVMIELERIKFMHDRAREELLRVAGAECPGENCYADDVYVSIIKPEPTVNFRKLVEYLDVPQNQLNKFKEEKQPYMRVTIERKIEIPLYQEDN